MARIIANAVKSPKKIVGIKLDKASTQNPKEIVKEVVNIA